MTSENLASYSLSKPWIYSSDLQPPNKDWYIFPNTTLSELYLDDCNDTVIGTCPIVDKIENCIKICNESGNCSGGYFLETPDSQNLCVPLRKYDYSQTHPFYRMRRQDIYPELRNVKSTFFNNVSFQEYPPNMANRILFNDNLVLKNKNTGLCISIDKKLAENVAFTKDNPVFLQFIPLVLFRTGVQKYVPVKDGDFIGINIPTTAALLRKAYQENKIVWSIRAGGINSESNTFKIHTKIKRKDPDSAIPHICYDDEVYFTFQDQLVNLDSNHGVLYLLNKKIEDSLQEGDNILWQIIPKVEVFYCEDGECKKTSLEDTVVDHEKSSYKGYVTGRNPTCWGLCHEKKEQNTVKIISLVIILVVCLILAYLYYRKN